MGIPLVVRLLLLAGGPLVLLPVVPRLSRVVLVVLVLALVPVAHLL